MAKLSTVEAFSRLLLAFALPGTRLPLVGKIPAVLDGVQIHRYHSISSMLSKRLGLEASLQVGISGVKNVI